MAKNDNKKTFDKTNFHWEFIISKVSKLISEDLSKEFQFEINFPVPPTRY